MYSLQCAQAKCDLNFKAHLRLKLNGKAMPFTGLKVSNLELQMSPKLAKLVQCEQSDQ